jgi:hypothetical protein
MQHKVILSIGLAVWLAASVSHAQGFAPVVGRAGEGLAPAPVASVIPITPTSIVEDALAAVKKTLAPIKPITPQNPYVKPVYVPPPETVVQGSAVAAPQAVPIHISQTYVQVAPGSFVVRPASALVAKPPPEQPEPPLQTESSIFGAMLGVATSTTLPVSPSLPSGEGLLFNNTL